MTGREHLRQIAHLARSVSGALALETVLTKVTKAVTELLPEAGSVIRLVDEEASGYRLAATGVPPPMCSRSFCHLAQASRKPWWPAADQFLYRTVPLTPVRHQR